MHIVRWIAGATVFLALLFLSLQNSDTATLKFFNLASWTAPRRRRRSLPCIRRRAGIAGGRVAGVTAFAADQSAPAGAARARYRHAQSIAGNGSRHGAGDRPRIHPQRPPSGRSVIDQG